MILNETCAGGILDHTPLLSTQLNMLPAATARSGIRLSESFKDVTVQTTSDGVTANAAAAAAAARGIHRRLVFLHELVRAAQTQTLRGLRLLLRLFGAGLAAPQVDLINNNFPLTIVMVLLLIPLVVFSVIIAILSAVVRCTSLPSVLLLHHLYGPGRGGDLLIACHAPVRLHGGRLLALFRGTEGHQRDSG